MKEKMTLSRVLKEIKLLDSKIPKKVTQIIPIAVGSVDGKRTNHNLSREDLEKEMSSGYQSLTDLMERRTKLKSVLNLANVTTKVKVGDKEMTIQDCIDSKVVLRYKKDVLRKMEQSLAHVASSIEHNEKEIQQKVDAQYITAVGTGKQNTNVDRMGELYQSLLSVVEKSNKLVEIDPLRVRTLTKELEEEIESFEFNVDDALNEINAITTVEV